MDINKENSHKCLSDNCQGSCDTQLRILEASIKLFSRKSYKLVTVAQICKLAEANIAAVNYHFGGKENLYRKTWQTAFERSISKYPPAGGVSEGAPAEARFTGCVRALLQRIADPECAELNIMINEMTNPTGLLQEVSARAIEPLRKNFNSLISKLTGLGKDDPRVMLCQLSVVGQCMHIMMRRRMSQPLPPGHWHDDMNIDVLSEHIIEFSLAGISHIRNKGRGRCK